MTYRYLIIGGGMTADAAAKAVRAEDPTGTIALLSAEPDAPYKRPPLSKGLWTDTAVERTDLKTAGVGVEMLLATSVTALDLTSRTVTLADGSAVGFEYLLLATGAAARALPGLPVGGPVIAYRTLADYRVARERVKQGARVLVVGGGFIGSELTAGLSRAGAEVHLVFPEAAIGASRFPAALAAAITADYVARGVTVHANSSLKSAKHLGERVEATLEDGTQLPFDLVAVGIGTRPNDELAASAGLATGNGVLVDSQLRAQRITASGATEPLGYVFAAGDVAAFPWPSPLAAGRIEHEDNAVMMGGHAGRQLVAAYLAEQGAGAGRDGAGSDSSGAEALRATPYRHLPFFYSDLFDNGYEAVGVLDSRLDMVEDWYDGLAAGVVYYLSAKKVVGVLLWNTWGLVDAARDLVLADAVVDPAQLTGRLRP